MVATCYLLGVSTRRMDKIVQTLRITGLSKSKVSVMAQELDAQVEAFRTRPLDAGPYTFVAADALTMKVRENKRVVKIAVMIAVMIATGVNAAGYRETREILGVHTSSTEFDRVRSRVAQLLPGPGRPRLDQRRDRSGSSPPTRTLASSKRSVPPCPARAGNDAAPTTPRT